MNIALQVEFGVAPKRRGNNHQRLRLYTSGMFSPFAERAPKSIRKFSEKSTSGDLTQISGFYRFAGLGTPGQGGFVRALQECPVGIVRRECLDKLYLGQYLQGLGDTTRSECPILSSLLLVFEVCGALTSRTVAENGTSLDSTAKICIECVTECRFYAIDNQSPGVVVRRI